MITSLGAFLPLAGQAVTAPRVAFRQVLDTPADRPLIIRFAMLVILFNLILGLLADVLMPPPDGAVTISTMAAFIMHMASIFGGAGMMFAVGRVFQGRGSLDGALKAVTWFSFVMLIAQGFFLAALLIVPGAAAALVLLLLFIFSMIQLCGVTMELHGFENPILVVFGIIGAAIIFGFFMLILLALLGVELPTAPAPA